MLLLVVAPPHEAARIRDALEPLQGASELQFVDTASAGLKALHERLWDATILAVPKNDFEPSRTVATFIDLAHGAPVIAVVDAIGEDTAAEMVRLGAADVVSFARLTRLPAVLKRELRVKTRIVAHQQQSRTAYSWFASIVNHIPVGIVYHNARGEIVLCNETALKLLGLTEEELLGVTAFDPLWNIIQDNGDPFPGWDLPATEAARTKRPVRNVDMGVFRPATGDRVWVRVDAIPVLDNDERLAHVVVQFSEITEQRRMSEALRTSERHFRSAFEHSGTGMLILSLDLKVLQANATASDIFDRKHEDLIGRTMQELTHSDDIAFSLERGARVLNDPSEAIAFEKRYVQPSGRVVWGAVTVKVLPDHQGKPLHFVASVQDITMRKDAEAERNRLHAQLLQAQKMEALGVLAGGVAHDFNNILAAILCSSDVLLHDLRNNSNAGEMPEIVSELQSAAQRGADLVRQILTFSRSANKRRVPLDPASAIQETLVLLRKRCPTNIDIQVTIRSHPLVFADATQMQQVLTNLCTNAFYAIENAKGIVSIELEGVTIDDTFAQTVASLREGAYAHIRVTDNGSGMDAHTLEHIFEPFFTTKGAGSGTGLGMAVVHGIVMAHEGAIRVQSTAGQGTTIDLWFPAVPGVAHARGSPKPGVMPGKGEHVFVVDDEVGLARIFGRLLQGIGYRVTVQTESTKALELFQTDPSLFHVALIDLHMPHPGGIEVAHRLHELRPDLPIFIMSGYSDALGDALPKELGVVGILQKPVTRETLATELRKVLDRSVAK